MAQKRPTFGYVLAVLTGIFAVLIALPQDWKAGLPGFMDFIKTPSLHLGLDLAGGTQLDFRISEEEIESQIRSLDAEIAKAKENGAPQTEIDQLTFQKSAIEQQKTNLVEAIRTVIERRVNSLGVSEAVITPSYIGDEKHLLVECPGVVDVQKCISVVGKTIQLEFKEESTEITPEEVAAIRANADLAYRRITQSGSNLQKEGQDLGTALGMAYQDNSLFFRDELPKGLEDLWNAPKGQLLKKDGSITQPIQQADGTVAEQEIKGIFMAEVLQARTQTGRTINEASKAFDQLAKTEQGMRYELKEKVLLDDKLDTRIAAALRGMEPGALKTAGLENSAAVLFLRSLNPGGQKVDASNILVSYQGANQADRAVTRTKQEALAKAQDLKKQLDAGADFATLARAQSDGAAKANGGKMEPFGRGELPATIEQAAFSLPAGSVSDPVETAFGYHLVKVDRAPYAVPAEADFEQLTVNGTGALARADDIVKRLQNGEVKSTEEAVRARVLFFSLAPTGWKDTPLDGTHFRSAAVVFDPTTQIPVVQITFDAEGAQLFQELTRNNVGKRIAIFVGGELVSAPTVQNEIAGGTAVITGSANPEEARTLAQDLNTGAIPAPIYLTGQYTIEATLGESALQASLLAGAIGIAILMLYMILVYRVLGVIADLALLVYAVLLFAILKLPLFLVGSDYIVLTLAGMAGIILSIGMAVDANILVFERMREELRRGKALKAAVEGSFTHSWPAIRDGNMATLISCGILFLIGTSIVRGFAITLAMGVMLSMFTAVVVTRWLMRHFVNLPASQNRRVFFSEKTLAKNI